MLEITLKKGYNMYIKRPRLHEALAKMKLWQSQGVDEATETLNMYDELLDTHGEFAAGRFIIDVVLETTQELKGVARAQS